MKEDVKKRWVKALRSGKYRQGVNALRKKDLTGDGRSDVFCCYGVLCDLYREDHPDTSRWKESYGTLIEFQTEEQMYNGGGAGGIPPRQVKEWAGLPKHDILTVLNDRWWTFEQLADLIERDLVDEIAEELHGQKYALSPDTPLPDIVQKVIDRHPKASI